MADGKQFVVIFSLNPSTVERLAQDLPKLQDTLNRVAVGSFEQLFRSVGGDSFAFLIRSTMVSKQILAALETPETGFNTTPMRSPFLTQRDRVVVMEVGSDVAGQSGFARALTWLQRR